MSQGQPTSFPHDGAGAAGAGDRLESLPPQVSENAVYRPKTLANTANKVGQPFELFGGCGRQRWGCFRLERAL